ncbi:proteinase inhibitor I3 [Tanacetum coccineum]|uniref:Proteinase inhibitor I3 n=1 Tax=Tanacetum coccineum TaxID=301880 RepID=A0ABQ5BCG5_9ASTR
MSQIPCRGSNIMKVTSNETKGFKSATIGGESNKPESCFQLVEADMMPGLRSYQIQLCPFKCGTNTSTSLHCYNVGLVANDVGKKFLATTEVIYPVVFKNSFEKAVQSASQSSTADRDLESDSVREIFLWRTVRQIIDDEILPEGS